MLFPPLVFAAILIACDCLTTFTIGATLAEDEVDALRIIAKTLGKTDWNFSIDPCSGEKSWNGTVDSGAYDNKDADRILCNCSFNNNTTCHVLNITLKGQNLPGTLPPELVRLPFLQEIDLTRNYLNGTIPSEWGSMQLIKIALLGNRLTGSIPKQLGNLSSLTELVLEHNNLSGTLPEELGNLSNIERLFLNSNNFTGELPETFAKLTTLKDFRISDNNFKGQIPHFIQYWKKLEKLHMHASGLSGPIPSAIDAFENIIDLRISDLNGAEGPFPHLAN